MTYKKISEDTGINYSTVKKYVKLLREKGCDTEPTDDLADHLVMINNQTKKGVSLDNAIGYAYGMEPHITDTEALRDLIRKVDDLEKTNRIQSDLLQIYLSRVNELESYMRKALPPPNESPWQAFLRMLGIRKKP